MEILEIRRDRVLGQETGVLLIKLLKIEPSRAEGGKKNGRTFPFLSIVPRKLLADTDRLGQRQWFVRPRIRRKTGTRQHFVGHTNIRNEIGIYVAAMKPIDHTPSRIRQQDGGIVRNRQHINHIHIALYALAPDPVSPPLYNNAGEPTIPFWRTRVHY